MRKLIDILPPNLKAGLTLAERRVLEAAPKGEVANLQVGDEEIDDPANADKWDDSRTIRAKFLHWLCTNEEATKLVHAKGIRVHGVTINDHLGFAHHRVPKPLFMTVCKIANGIDFRWAKTGPLGFDHCDIGSFIADGLNADGLMAFSDTNVAGGIRLPGAYIASDLKCNDMVIESPGSYSFIADNITVNGKVDFVRVITTKQVRFSGATIHGEMNFSCSFLEDKNNWALMADYCHIKTTLYLKGASVKGGVQLIGAQIGADLDLRGACLHHGKIAALCLERSTISGTLILGDLLNLIGITDLMGTHVRRICDDGRSWPEKGNLRLDGFTFGAFAEDEITPKDVSKRLEWLRLQPSEPFASQPYEQLAKVYRSMGHEAAARKVLIAKQDDLLKNGDLEPLGKVANWLYGFTLCHGYRVNRVLYGFLSMFIIGWLFFWIAYSSGIMQPTKENVYLQSSFKTNRTLPPEYPKMEPALYSLDALVPLVNLHQEDYWLPDITEPGKRILLGWSWGWFIRGYLWFHIIMGWILTSLLATYVGRKILKD